MRAEIDYKQFFKSEWYKTDQEHLEWVNKNAQSMLENYLWQPVKVGVSTGYLHYVHQQTGGREVPPYGGILNPFDEEGNFVLFPWFRTQDLYELGSKILSQSSNINGIMGGWVGLLDPANLVAHCDHRLVIPRSEVVMMARDSHGTTKQ